MQSSGKIEKPLPKAMKAVDNLCGEEDSSDQVSYLKTM